MLHLLRTSLPTLADPDSAASHNLARPALHDACHACEACLEGTALRAAGVDVRTGLIVCPTTKMFVLAPAVSGCQCKK